MALQEIMNYLRIWVNAKTSWWRMKEVFREQQPCARSEKTQELVARILAITEWKEIKMREIRVALGSLVHINGPIAQYVLAEDRHELQRKLIQELGEDTGMSAIYNSESVLAALEKQKILH